MPEKKKQAIKIPSAAMDALSTEPPEQAPPIEKRFVEVNIPEHGGKFRISWIPSYQHAALKKKFQVAGDDPQLIRAAKVRCIHCCLRNIDNARLAFPGDENRAAHLDTLSDERLDELYEVFRKHNDL